MAYEPGTSSRFALPAGERESFFAAQRRHRRVAFRYGVLATIAVLLQSLPATVLLAPFLYCLLLLGSDVMNLAVPVPDLFKVGAWLFRDVHAGPQFWSARPWAASGGPLADLPLWVAMLVL